VARPENPLEPTDRELMEAVQRDEPGAFDGFVRRYQRRFYRIACRYLRDHELALDAVQEAFVKIYHARSRWEPRAQPFTWAYRIVANHCIDLLRREGKARAATESLDEEGSAAARTVGDERSLDPERAVGLRELGEVLRRALAELPESQREILVMRHFEEMSLQEIADCKHWPLGTVKSALHRATHSLKLRLRGAEEALHGHL
jgi:RNA polymerase sigma-70 factor (ECF subfamily)